MARSRRTWIAIAALIAAIAVWVGFAYRALQPDGGITAANDRAWVAGLVLLGCALDAILIVRISRAQVGRLGLLWLGLRAFVSAVGFLFFTFPFYAIALVAVTGARLDDPRTDPHLPHSYRPISTGWFGALTPMWWSRNLLGASQIGESACVICRETRDAPIHASAA
jgi:hypothetical protein